MKAFYASLTAFALLLLLITCNVFYVKRTTAELQALLADAIAPDGAALSSVEDKWQQRKKMLALTASYEEIRMLDEHLIAMRAAALTGARADYERARLLAIEVLARICEQEKFSPDNLF